MADPFEVLPSEILVKVFSHLPPLDVFFGVSHVSYRWRKTVHSNLRRLPLIPVHCSVEVFDTESGAAPRDGTNSMISYTFTVYDKQENDFKNSQRKCKKGNSTKFSEIWISHRMGAMECEFERKQPEGKQIRLDTSVAETLLSYMRLEALRFDVRKQGRKTVARMTDDRFAHALAFCEQVCGSVNIKSLLLSSRSPSFPWCFGDLSQKRLAGLSSLRYVTLENMTSPDCFGQGKVVGGMDFSQMQSLQLKMDITHKQEIENTIWVELDGNILSKILSVRKRLLDFSAYVDVPQAITGITAGDMCDFVKSWRCLVAPWLIRCIQFNSTVSISEFRTVASRTDLFNLHHLKDIPYCRFRTFHPSDPSCIMELCCYGNGTATLWQIRSGYLNAVGRR